MVCAWHASLPWTVPAKHEASAVAGTRVAARVAADRGLRLLQSGLRHIHLSCFLVPIE
jgi:hypothetical protein